jgi:ABC-2 type transport system permease protein
VIQCLIAVVAVARRGFTENVRAYPIAFAANHVATSLFTVLTVFTLHRVVFAGRVSSDFEGFAFGAEYLPYVVVGLAIMTLCTGGLLSVGRGLMLEIRSGTAGGVLLAPISGLTYFSGLLLQDIVLSAGYAATAVAVGVAFGARFPHANWPTLVVTIAIGEIGLLGLGILLAFVMVRLRDTYLTQNTFLALLLLLSGALFPLQYLPRPLQYIGMFLPTTWTVRLARDAALGGVSIRSALPGLTILAVLSGLYLVLAMSLVGTLKRTVAEQGGV